MNSTQRTEVDPVTASDIHSLGAFVFGVHEMLEKGSGLEDIKRFVFEADIRQSAANAVNHRPVRLVE